MKTCSVGTCKRKHKANRKQYSLCGARRCKRKYYALGLCTMHYQRRRNKAGAHLFSSDDLRRAPLDDVAVNWLLGVFERLPEVKR